MITERDAFAVFPKGALAVSSSVRKLSAIEKDLSVV